MSRQWYLGNDFGHDERAKVSLLHQLCLAIEKAKDGKGRRACETEIQSDSCLASLLKALSDGEKELLKTPGSERLLGVGLFLVESMTDQLSRLRRSSTVLRWFRKDVTTTLATTNRRLRELRGHINTCLRSGRDAIGYAAVLGISELQKFWLNLARAGHAVPLDQLLNAMKAFLPDAKKKSAVSAAGLGLDTCRNGQVTTAEFCAAVDDLGMLTSRQKELTMPRIMTKMVKRIRARAKNPVTERPPILLSTRSHFFRGSDANMSTRSSSRCSRSARDFMFSLTEKGKRYGETKESEVKISKRIRLRKDMASRRGVKISARVSEAPVTRFGINFSGVIKVRVDLNDGARPRNFDIFIPGVKTYDPAGITGDPHASEAIGPSCSRFQSTVTAAQISAVIGGGDYDSIEEIQETARHVMAAYHGRSCLYEWMRHQIHSVLIRHETPMEYPAFIQVNYVDTGEFDLTDPRRAHTAKYLESYMNGDPVIPAEFFSKLEGKGGLCDAGPGALPAEAKPPTGRVWDFGGAASKYMKWEDIESEVKANHAKASTTKNDPKRPEEMLPDVQRFSSTDRVVSVFQMETEVTEVETEVETVVPLSSRAGSQEPDKATAASRQRSVESACTTATYADEGEAISELGEDGSNSIREDYVEIISEAGSDSKDSAGAASNDPAPADAKGAEKLFRATALRGGVAPETVDKLLADGLTADTIVKLSFLDIRSVGVTLGEAVKVKHAFAKARQEREEQRLDHARLATLRDLGILLSFDDVDMAAAVKLGSGNFGTALLVERRAPAPNAPKRKLVVKVPHHRGVTKSDWREIRASLRVRYHRNLLQLVGLLYHKSRICLVSPYCERGSIDTLHDRIKLHENPLLCRAAAQLAAAVRHLHESDPVFVHRDIRCANILLDANGDVQLGDWGLARDLKGTDVPHKMSSGTALPWPWSAPEALIDRVYEVSSDVYMVGVALWEIMTRGADPYDYKNLPYSLNIKQFARKVQEGSLKLEFPTGGDAKISKIAKACLAGESKKRPSVAWVHESLDKLRGRVVDNKQ